MEVIIYLLIIVLVNIINLDLVSIFKYWVILLYIDIGRFVY